MRLDVVCAGVIALSALQIARGQKPSEYMMGKLFMRGYARRDGSFVGLSNACPVAGKMARR